MGVKVVSIDKKKLDSELQQLEDEFLKARFTHDYPHNVSVAAALINHYERHDDPSGLRVVITLERTAGCHAAAGRLDLAEETHERLLALAKDIHASPSYFIARATNRLAEVQYKRRHWPEAEINFDLALAELDRVEQSENEAWTPPTVDEWLVAKGGLCSIWLVRGEARGETLRQELIQFIDENFADHESDPGQLDQPATSFTEMRHWTLANAAHFRKVALIAKYGEPSNQFEPRTPAGDAHARGVAYADYAAAAMTFKKYESAALLWGAATTAFVNANNVDRAADSALGLAECEEVSGNLEAALTSYTLAGDGFLAADYPNPAMSQKAFAAAAVLAAKLNRPAPQPMKTKRKWATKWRRTRPQAARTKRPAK